MHKDDLVNNAEQMDEFCRENGFMRWFEVSVKENINIEVSFEFLISEVKSLFCLDFNSNTLIFLKMMKHPQLLQQPTQEDH